MYNSGPGAEYLETLQGMVTGNVGFFIGLAVVVLGLLTLIFKRDAGAALLMIIGGALITMAPAVFNITYNFVADVLATVGDGNNTVVPGR